MSHETSHERFMSTYPILEGTILDAFSSYHLPPPVSGRLHELLRANLLGGKLSRGMSVPNSISILLNKSLTDEEYSEAATLGWIVELLQAFFLVHDDIMDGSSMRRGKPCWYLMQDVGMSAINDACLLESSAFLILKKHFGSHPNYLFMFELIHDAILKTEIGQLMDLTTSSGGVIVPAAFTRETYRSITTYKTAYYSFYLPAALALFQSNRASARNLEQTKDILLLVGEYYQIQDDFLDNFGSLAQIGKVGTDIIENKCTWLIVRALEDANDQQQKIIEDNYGKNDVACEARIKRVYNELNLKKCYDTIKYKYQWEIERKVDSIDDTEGLPKSLFRDIWGTIYERTK